MKFVNPFKVNKLVMKELQQLQQMITNWEMFWTQQSDATTDYIGGNPYASYDSAIAELSKKYEGTAYWGNDQARTIVDVRAAFTIGNGIQVVEIDPKTKKALLSSSGKYAKEMDFINGFIKHNNLDEEGVQELAKEAEIEGRTLLKIIPDPDGNNIDIRFISYNTNHYKVKTNAEDYLKYESVEYRRPDNQAEVKLQANEFVYKKFAGRTDKVNDIMPKTALILRKLEDLDKALKDLREINNLFASPTPHFNCEDAAAANDLRSIFQKINWKIGKVAVTAKTTFTMVSADAAGAESIVKEIVSICKVISGCVGIPVHFLGLPDLMSNRAVSTDMFEMIIASTNRERKTWVGTWEEVFKKAMEMSNNTFGTSFNTEVISCDIPQITAEKLKELVDVWLPLYQSNVVDLDYMLSMIPNADPERIKNAAKLAAQQNLDALKAQMEADNNDADTGRSGAPGEGEMA